MGYGAASVTIEKSSGGTRKKGTLGGRLGVAAETDMVGMMLAREELRPPGR